MKHNMGNWDRGLRLLVAATLGLLFYFNIISGILGIALLTLAGVFTLTSLCRTCPLYQPLGISTDKKEPPSCSMK